MCRRKQIIEIPFAMDWQIFLGYDCGIRAGRTGLTPTDNRHSEATDYTVPVKDKSLTDSSVLSNILQMAA